MKNWYGLNVLHELPDDSFGIETCNNVEYHSLNKGSVLFYFIIIQTL